MCSFVVCVLFCFVLFSFWLLLFLLTYSDSMQGKYPISVRCLLRLSLDVLLILVCWCDHTTTKEIYSNTLRVKIIHGGLDAVYIDSFKFSFLSLVYTFWIRSMQNSPLMCFWDPKIFLLCPNFNHLTQTDTLRWTEKIKQIKRSSIRSIVK